MNPMINLKGCMLPCLLLLGPALLAQNATWAGGRNYVSTRKGILRRNDATGYLEFAKDLPALGTGPMLLQEGPSLETIWDGNEFYCWHRTDDGSINVWSAFMLEQREGRTWSWSHAPAHIDRKRRIIAADSGYLILEEPNHVDPKDGKCFRIHRMDLADGRMDLLYSVKDSDRKIYSVAASVDHDIYIFTTLGDVFKLSAGSTQLTHRIESFWKTLSDKYVEKFAGMDGVFVNTPPQVLGPPFFNSHGEILIPMNVHETNTWTEELFVRAFNDLTEAEKAEWIKIGAWPLRDKRQLLGVESTFVLLKYDPSENKMSVVPNESLVHLLERNKYTMQWRLKDRLPPLGEGPNEKILPIADLLR